MKAIEFVKEHGWDCVIDIVKTYGDSYTHIAKDVRAFINEQIYCKHVPHFADSIKKMIRMDDLKRLVESWELVEKVGGIDKAKMLLRMRIAAELYDSADEIEKAIADVESVNN